MTSHEPAKRGKCWVQDPEVDTSDAAPRYRHDWRDTLRIQALDRRPRFERGQRGLGPVVPPASKRSSRSQPAALACVPLSELLAIIAA